MNMNDISRCSKKLSLILFGDDTNLFHSHKNVDISCNKLSLNVKKTHFMVFKPKRKKQAHASF